MILSHHGELEYGSPKVPLFPEALLLHHIDNMDSKMECMRSFIERDRLVEGCWTAYVSSLDRSVLKKGKFLQDGVTAAPQAAAAVASQPAPPVAVNAPPRPPGPPPSPVPPAAPPVQTRPSPVSAFAEKLKGALGGDK